MLRAAASSPSSTTPSSSTKLDQVFRFGGRPLPELPVMSQTVPCKLDGFTCGDISVHVSEAVSARDGDQLRARGCNNGAYAVALFVDLRVAMKQRLLRDGCQSRKDGGLFCGRWWGKMGVSGRCFHHLKVVSFLPHIPFCP